MGALRGRTRVAGGARPMDLAKIRDQLVNLIGVSDPRQRACASSRAAWRRVGNAERRPRPARSRRGAGGPAARRVGRPSRTSSPVRSTSGRCRGQASAPSFGANSDSFSVRSANRTASLGGSRRPRRGSPDQVLLGGLVQPSGSRRGRPASEHRHSHVERVGGSMCLKEPAPVVRRLE